MSRKNLTALVAALVVTLASGTALAAMTTWSKSESFGKATARMIPDGNLFLSIDVADLKGDSTAVAVEANIVSGDKTTFFQVENYLGKGNTRGQARAFDGGDIGFSGHVKIRVCKVRKFLGGDLTWGCSGWSSRSYSL